MVQQPGAREGRGRVEAPLTGLGSAGIRALQILFVREPAAGIAAEGVETLLRATFAVRRAFWGAFCGGLTSNESSARALRGWAQGVDESVSTVRMNGDRPTSGRTRSPLLDEKTLNLSVSDDSRCETEKILPFEVRAELPGQMCAMI